MNTAFLTLAIVFAMMCSTLALATLTSFIDVWLGSTLALSSLGGLLASVSCVRVK